MQHAQLHFGPKPRNKEQGIECCRETGMLKKGPEIYMLLTLGVVSEDGPPKCLRIFVRRMAQLSLIEPNSFVDQSVRRSALVWKMLSERADEMGMESLSLWLLIWRVTLSR